MGQPDVGAKGIFTATEDDDIVGYAAVGRPKSAGGIFRIHELCYDSEKQGREIVTNLLEKALSYAQEKGGTGISLDAPSDDNTLREVCNQMGLSHRTGRRPAYAVVVIDMPDLLTKIMTKRTNNPAESHIDFAIKLVDLPPPNIVVVRNVGGRLTVSTEDFSTAALTIETDYATMTSLIFGSESVLGSVLGGRVRIKPFRSSFRGLRILSKIRLLTPWFIPRTDQI